MPRTGPQTTLLEWYSGLYRWICLGMNGSIRRPCYSKFRFGTITKRKTKRGSVAWLGKFTLRDRTLRGSNINLQASNLTPAQVIAYPQYKKWLSKNLSAGRNEDSDTYVCTSNRNSKKECDEWVNSRPHQHGPLSTRPT
jgi:hypothetical protein